MFAQQQWRNGFRNIERGNGNSCLPHPYETVLIAGELEVLVQVLQDEPLVPGIQFGRYELEYVIQVQFLCRVTGLRSPSSIWP